MSARTWKVALPLLLFCTLLLNAAPAPRAEQIARWVEQLGDNDFNTREKASQSLWEAGQAAEDALLQAAKSADPEVRRRAAEILDKFRWGIYHDTPPDLVDLIHRYQAGQVNEKQAVIRELFAKGSKGCAILMKLANNATDPAVHQAVFAQLALEASRAFPALIAENNYGTLEMLLDLALTLEHDDLACQNYAVYWLLRGKVDERIALLLARREPPKETAAAEALTFLYRAKGDLPAARQAAERSGRRDLVELVMNDQEDWKGLAALTDQQALENIEALGLRAAYHRLAGDVPGLEKVIADIQKYAANRKNEDEVWLPAKALLLNGRPQEALALIEKGRNMHVAFEVLIAQMRYREAFALVEKARAAGHKDLPILEALQARTLWLLGEKEKAETIADRFREEIKQGKTDPWLEVLVQSEHRTGQRDLALEHCAQLLVNHQGANGLARVLELVLPDNGERGEMWWKVLRQRRPNLSPVDALKQVRQLVEGKVSGKDLEAAAAEAEEVLKGMKAEEREPWLLFLADAALAAGLGTTAKGYLEKAAAGSPEAQVRLGDYFAGKKQWEAAVERYGEVWPKEHGPNADASASGVRVKRYDLWWQKKQQHPLPLYLKGWALSQSGAAEEGAKLMEMARWLPLGDESLRYAFVEELTKRGQDEAARRERDLILRTSRPGSYYQGEALRRVSLEALKRKDFLKAAVCLDRALLRVLQPNTDFLENTAYITVPYFIHRLRARGLLAAGKLDEARQEIAVCAALEPANVDLTIALLPELEKRGNKKEAQDLFAQALATQLQFVTDYPGSAWVHNNLAWLCAACRRDLDTGLDHARRAVELSPDNTGYLDTLAEVLFQRGDKEKAIEMMKKAIALNGMKPYFQKQLQRFEAGDRNAEIPESDDDD
jgi:tetratricopeptide (TPR) repeat protein